MGFFICYTLIVKNIKPNIKNLFKKNLYNLIISNLLLLYLYDNIFIINL